MFLIVLQEKIKKKVIEAFTLFFSILLNCLISQSLYACFYHFVCVIGISFILNRRFTYLLLIIGFFSFVSIVASFILFPEARIISLLNLLQENPELLLQQGAIVRALNIPISFINLSYYGFGVLEILNR